MPRVTPTPEQEASVMRALAGTTGVEWGRCAIGKRVTTPPASLPPGAWRAG